MYTTIAVPLDASRFSERAIPYAVALAQRAGGRLHLMHVLARASSGWRAEPRPARTRQELQQYLDRLADRIREETGVAATGTLLEGNIVESLRAHADEIEADVVVMTTHGRGGFERAWLGSVADHFVRIAERPVLLVPDGEESELDLRQLPALRKVLVPLDGSALAEEILTPAVKLADGEPVEFVLVRVATLPPLSGVYGTAAHAVHLVDEERGLRREKQREAKEYLESMRSSIEDPSRPVVPTVLFASEPAPAILEHAREAEVDLIAIATRGRGGVSRMLFGSVADKVIRAVSPPVLVYRPRAEAATVATEAPQAMPA